jgi:hypothetical protein
VPESPSTSFDPNLELIVVFESNDPVEIAFAKGALDEAGIPLFGLNQIATLVQDVDPMLRKVVRLQVAADREQEAREALSILRMSMPTSGEA